MAAKMISEKSTVTSVSGTITRVYTVPANKAARVRIMFAFENNGSGTGMCLFAGTDSTQAIAKHHMPANVDFWTGMRSQGSDADQSNYPGNVGMHQISLGGTIIQQNNHQHYLLAPMPIDYYLAAGDKVRFGTTDNSSVLNNCLFYVVGVEDDA